MKGALRALEAQRSPAGDEIVKAKGAGREAERAQRGRCTNLGMR